MLKRISLFVLLGVFLATFFVFGALVNAAPPRQDNVPPVTPKATRDPIKQATRQVVRALATAIPEPIAADEVAVSEDEAAEIAPTAPGPMTSTILIFNPDTSGAATVQVDIYDASGAVAHTTNLNVSANGMKLVSLPGSLGTNFQGGAQISSDKNVQAIVVGANSNKTARDSYQGTTAPALDVTLPFVRHLAANTQNSLLAIQNTTSNDAEVTATFYNFDGSAADTQDLNIAAHQSAFLNTNAVFPSSMFVGSARVVSNQEVAVAAQTLYYKDTAAFDGTSASDSDTILFLNQAERKINGSNVALNWSEIFVRNNGVNATDVTLEFYSSAGALVTSSTASAVPAEGAEQFLLKDAAFAALGNSYNGWVKISSTGEPLAATMLQVLNQGKRMYSINALGNSIAGARYVCGDTSRMATQNSRISILNTGAVNAKVILRLYDPASGAKLVQSKVVIPPNTTTTVMLSDTKFAAAGTNYQGMALVNAKGAAPPNLVVTVNNPYGNPKLSGTTGYDCTKIQ